MVYVQNISGLPLMPCTEAKARHLLKEHKAEIVNYAPFTIRLRFVVDDITQPLTLGVDSGYKSIGLSATTETKVLFEAEVELRDDVTNLLTARREQLGFWNTREYVLWRDGHKCRHCSGRSKDNIFEVHHLVQRKDGGSDRPDNLITLCATCHDAYHRGEFKLDKPKRGFRAETFMTVMRWTLVNRLKAKYGDDMIGVTYGYITKHTRIENNLEKAHYIDARCISGNATAKPNGKVWRKTKQLSHNRQINKCTILKGGGRKLNQGPRVIFSFRLFDVVMYNGRLGDITSRRTRGAFKITWFDDNTSTDGINYKQLKLVRHSRNIDIS